MGFLPKCEEGEIAVNKSENRGDPVLFLFVKCLRPTPRSAPFLSALSAGLLF